MNSNKERDADINMDVMARCMLKIRELINKGVAREAFTMEDGHAAATCCLALDELVKHCDVLQKKSKIVQLHPSS